MARCRGFRIKGHPISRVAFPRLTKIITLSQLILHPFDLTLHQLLCRNIEVFTSSNHLLFADVNGLFEKREIKLEGRLRGFAGLS
jgi:hypothetical protein